MMSKRRKAKAHEMISLPQQNYIESIAELSKLDGHAHTCKLADRLNVSPPSVSEAVTRLVENGIAVRKSSSDIVLTSKGKKIAGQLDSRQRALQCFMVEVMAMKPGRADELACRIEHCIDRDFSDRLLKLAEFLQREYPSALEGISDYLQVG